jgi:type IV secretory pathway TrbF-like protein
VKEPRNKATIPFNRNTHPDSAKGDMVNQLTRQRWHEEWARHVYERNLWQKVAFISLGVNVLAVLGMCWFGSQTKIVPYIVEVDKLGAAAAVQRADTPMIANAANIKAHLARWIENTRSVYTDIAAEKKAVNQAYSSVNNNSPAFNMLNDYFVKNEPFKRAETESVTVSVETIQPISEKTWRIEWQEDHKDRNGGLTSHQEQQATVTLVINPPTDEATILVNPLGIYIDSFSWSQRV